jgi:hypothetical protein
MPCETDFSFQIRNVLAKIGQHLTSEVFTSRNVKTAQGETIKTHDILNEDLIQRHKSMSLLAYKIQKDDFRVTDPTCKVYRDQIDHRADQMPLVIDATISNVITADI